MNIRPKKLSPGLEQCRDILNSKLRPSLHRCMENVLLEAKALLKIRFPTVMRRKSS